MSVAEVDREDLNDREGGRGIRNQHEGEVGESSGMFDVRM